MSAVMKSAFFVLLLNVLVVSSQDIDKKFVDSKIVPKVIPKAPRDLMKISFPGGKTPELGAKLKAKDVKYLPTISFKNETGFKYVAVMFDINASNATNQTQHWLVSDIQSAGSVVTNITQTDYVGVLPDHKGSRQFVVLVYQQGLSPIIETHLDASNLAGRANFSITQFVAKYDLGDPVAGIFFEVNASAAVKSCMVLLISALVFVMFSGKTGY